jgi:hypothetical protein
MSLLRLISLSTIMLLNLIKPKLLHCNTGIIAVNANLIELIAITN